MKAKALLVVVVVTVLAVITWIISGCERTPTESLVVHFRGHTIDTTQPGLPPDLAFSDDGSKRARLVQFKHNLSAAERTDLTQRFDLSLDRYIHPHTYLEYLDADEVQKMSRLSSFHWSAAYPPGFKVNPAIGTRTFTTDWRREYEGTMVIVHAFEWADVDSLVSHIEQSGGTIQQLVNEIDLGKIMALVRIEDISAAVAIAQHAGVDYIEEMGEVVPLNNDTSWAIQSGVPDARPAWTQGLFGDGVVVGQIDYALYEDSCFFSDLGKIVDVRNINPGTDLQEHGTHVAGVAVGEHPSNHALSTSPHLANPHLANGMAPHAKLTYGYVKDLLLAFADGTVSFESYLVAAHDDGARIHVNAWDDAPNSDYSGLSRAVDYFTWNHEEDLLIVAGAFGAGGAIGQSKNALVVNTYRTTSKTAYGVTKYTSDGRRKPDVLAPGINITSADVAECGTISFDGTSQAAGAVAGAAAIVRQYFNDGWYPAGSAQPSDEIEAPTGALVKAVLLNGTADLTPATGYPDGVGEGWGRLLLDDALYFLGDTRQLRVWDVPHSSGLTTGTTAPTRSLEVESGEELKVTLVWTDAPAEMHDLTPVRNNLDLRVVSPTEDSYLGNDFIIADKESNPNGTSFDELNNVEMVILKSPEAGTYTIEVIGTVINVGNPTAQGYALVVTGALEVTPAMGFCGSKKHCGDMTSCAEAVFYLQQCGLTGLDRDGDGVPCELICP
jgi:hypothetical protein